MDILSNLKAFLATARTGSFSEAARQMAVSPSVITKRIDQLEWRVRCALFERSTRKVELTQAGQRFLPRIQVLVNEIEETLAGISRTSAGLEGHIRVKLPTSVGILYFGRMFALFQKQHPKVSMDLMMIDRSVNPLEEGFDIAIGALPELYGNVVDEPLCVYPRVCCATPAYLAQRGTPTHPRDLVEHDCLTFSASGALWSFDSPRGPISVDIRSKFNSNDSHVLLASALEDNGIAIVANFIAAPYFDSGELVPVLAEFPLPELWLKALIPGNRVAVPLIQALVAWLKAEMAPVPPWERALTTPPKRKKAVVGGASRADLRNGAASQPE